MKLERYELKYRLPVDVVRAVRAHVARYCVLDRAALAGPYRICSLYLDTPDRRLYRETLDRQPQRFKLRVRRYDGPAHFVEIKHRVKQVIAKRRMKLPGGRWPEAWLDPRMAPEHPTWHEFTGLCLRLGVEPAALVRYEREAWLSDEAEYVRVTFDHHLCAARPTGWAVPIDGDFAPIDRPHRFGWAADSGVVLELKCLTAVPLWFRDLIHRFELERTGFSKYGAAIEALGPSGLTGASPRRSPWAA